MPTPDGSKASRAVRIVAVAGARPNFMKIAPLLRDIENRPDVEAFLVHTGQHYDQAMSENFFKDLRIAKPDLNLGVGSGSHAEQTASVLVKMEKVLLQEKPDLLLVVGDVNSTLAASLAAVKLEIPVAHVEAGLRSGDRSMPEEINRILTDSISTWLFTTEEEANLNLAAEGIPPERIHHVGNVMIDTLFDKLQEAKKRDTLERLGLESGQYALLTLHRPSNVDDPGTLRGIFDTLEQIHEKLPILFPVHPRTRASIEKMLGNTEPRLQLAEPMGYLDFLKLMAEARLVFTDSGGIQEETTALGVTCLTLRENTERPITVSEGTNTIVGSDPETILIEAEKALQGDGKAGRTPSLWDGQAAGRILDILEKDVKKIA
ncbi:MAG: UDP-N-acetylglucosamine 2-epimerase (non-hydrolyzing) [Myxococcota bacterium]|nr:UDP-N-acetylglucosamine 2-epimerase (non-hydrolyzing) [Myxococcota bacterium]